MAKQKSIKCFDWSFVASFPLSLPESTVGGRATILAGWSVYLVGGQKSIWEDVVEKDPYHVLLQSQLSLMEGYVSTH